MFSFSTFPHLSSLPSLPLSPSLTVPPLLLTSYHLFLPPVLPLSLLHFFTPFSSLVMLLSPDLPPSLSQAWLMVCWGEADGQWVRDCPCQPLTLGPIQAREMIDVKSNFKHPQFNFGRQTESGGQRLATQLGHPDKTYISSQPAGVCVHVCVCVCCLLIWNSLLDTGAICPAL